MLTLRPHRWLLTIGLILVAQTAAAQPGFEMPKPVSTFSLELMTTLQPPQGAVSAEGGAGQSRTGAFAHQTFGTKMTVDELLSYYQEKLGDSGWTAGTVQVEPDLAFEVLRRVDEDGSRYLGFLVVVATDPEHDLKTVAMQAFPVSAP